MRPPITQSWLSRPSDRPKGHLLPRDRAPGHGLAFCHQAEGQRLVVALVTVPLQLWQESALPFLAVMRMCPGLHVLV